MSTRCALVFAALFALILSPIASADHEHVHDLHPTTEHMGDFVRVSMSSNWQSPVSENLNGQMDRAGAGVAKRGTSGSVVPAASLPTSLDSAVATVSGMRRGRVRAAIPIPVTMSGSSASS